MNNVTLIVGDWGGDGHDKTEDYIYNINISYAELIAAYESGVAIIGYDLKDYCNDYEDREIPIELLQSVYNKLKELPVGEAWEIINDIVTLSEYFDKISVYHSEYAELYLAIAKIGNPDLTYQQVTGTTISIGGYGLFY